jgi:acetyl-CoA carboxylase/biotin carboxylase 1
MLKVGILQKWSAHTTASGIMQAPTDVFGAVELVLDEAGELQEVQREPGSNNIGMVAWRCTMQTPEYPEGREIVLIANDVTHQAGSFGVEEDVFFQRASAYARERGLPRIYISCNAGARVGLVEELKPLVQVRWTDPEEPSKGFEYLYLSEEDKAALEDGVVTTTRRVVGDEVHHVIDAVIGEGMRSTSGGIGVENLQGSALIAGETSRAYDEVFTLSYITGRSVGIGAYLNRLGQRTIQMVNGPMILTGFAALNKLLGRNVYTSQDQLGGPQVMVPNGVTHQLVQNDQQGVQAILDWLSFVPKDTWSQVVMPSPVDPPEREIDFLPSKMPYDPRHMLAGTTLPGGGELSGFFDKGTFKEYLAGWGRSVVVGRAKLGGIPMGVIAVETRNVDRRIPADPANPDSSEVIEPQAGQVWFPDSAFKTAQALRDFNRGENLPVMIFANWRGFSGGTRDMYGEVLKFGAQIVDALVDYKHPVFVYIPPGGELRGGSWVVIDPAINPQQMEMYADVESRGGILEPAGIVEVKFREAQRKEMMHRLDAKLKELDAELEQASSAGDSAGADMQEIEENIAAREEQLKPLYTQLACEFADLHDRTGRMEAKGVIRKGLEWKSARKFFYHRVKRRLLENEVVDRLVSTGMTFEDAKAKLESWAAFDSDEEAVAFLQNSPMEKAIAGVEVEALKQQILALKERLPGDEAKKMFEA